MRNAIIIVFSSLLLWGCNSQTEPETQEAPVVAEQAPAVVAETAAPSTACELTMGWNSYEPYQYEDFEGNVRGLEIELVKLIAQKADCNISFQGDEWRKLLQGLQSGTLHFVAGATQTPERENYALFSVPYRDESFVMFVRAGESQKWQVASLEEMVRDKKMRIGLVDGYVYGEMVNDLLDKPEYNKMFIQAPFSESHAAGLLDNKIDGMLEDPFVASAVIKRKNLGERLEAMDFTHKTGQVALMFSKASVSPEIVERFNKAIAEVQASGELDAISARYRK